MLVSFLICGLEGRPWKSLADNIQRQIDNASVECEVLTNVDSGEKSSGSKRHELTAGSSGKYVAFVDDDDSVSDDYVHSICHAVLTEEPDVVTFAMNVTIHHRIDKFKRFRVSNEKWSLGLWSDDRKKGKMAANHLCAWKKSIAEQVAWCPSLGYGDDQLWYGPLHAAEIAKTSVVIPRALYGYQFSWSSTKNQTAPRVQASRHYFRGGLRCYMEDGQILVEDGSQATDVIS